MKIAVASCCKAQQIYPQPVWEEIKTAAPDILLLLGDNIYLKHNRLTDPDRLRQELRVLYAKQMNEPGFRALINDIRDRGAKILAIYDDHDFIGNNRYGGDHDPALGEVARTELIENFAVPRTGNDAYSLTETALVDIVVLDARFYRRTPKISCKDRDAVLGARQWNWFEDTVNHSKAPFMMIGSSSTFHHFVGESWQQYPAAFERMRSLLSERQGKVIVSGDIHKNAMCDRGGVMEIVTSAVAKKRFFFVGKMKNYGIFTFTETEMNVDLKSLKSRWRFDVRIPLRDWRLQGRV